MLCLLTVTKSYTTLVTQSSFQKLCCEVFALITLSPNTAHRCIQKSYTYLYKMEAIHQYCAEKPLSSLGLSSSQMDKERQGDLLWSEESIFQLIFGKDVFGFSFSKERLWGYVQRYNQCTGICGSFRKTYFMLLSKQRLWYFSRMLQQNNFRPQQCSFIDTECVCSCSPDLSLIENLWHIVKSRIRQQWPQTVEELNSWARTKTFTSLLPTWLETVGKMMYHSGKPDLWLQLCVAGISAN